MLSLLLVLHVLLGSTAVIGMLIAWLSKKGDAWHRRGGKAYVLGMTGALIAAFAVSIATQNLFLFLIGVFSAYLVFTGYRIAAARDSVRASLDKLVAVAALTGALAMIGYAAFVFSNNRSTAIILTVLGVIFALQAFQDVRRGDKWPIGKERIVLHLNRMGGASIATVTAVFVVNVQTDPAFIAWLLPTVVGSLGISYWTKRTRGPVANARASEKKTIVADTLNRSRK